VARILLPDADEKREMVINAFATQTGEELRKLSHEVRGATASGVKGDFAAVTGLVRRFREQVADPVVRKYDDFLCSVP
jgi:hypothetical protein